MRSPLAILTEPSHVFTAALVLLAAGAVGCQPLEAKSPDEAASSEAAPAEPQAPSPEEAAKQAGRSNAESWLALIDNSQYGESWDAAAVLFQESTTKEQWGEAVKGARDPLGALTSRKFRAAEYKTSLPGAPEGTYVVVHYDSAFTEKPEAREIVTLRQATDGSWKVAGYFVQ